MATRGRAAAAAQQQVKQIPDYLVKEEIAGIPFYYKGYKEVLAGNKTPEEIMGSSGLQSVLVSFLFKTLIISLPDRQYWVLTNELGSHHGHKKNPSHDIAVFDKTVLTPNKITPKYTDVPAELVIEVDVDVELEQIEETQFIALKTKECFRFGVKRFIWVLSPARQVIVAEPEQDWLMIDWNKEIELIDGIKVNIGQYLKQEGIDLDPPAANEAH